MTAANFVKAYGKEANRCSVSGEMFRADYGAPR